MKSKEFDELFRKEVNGLEGLPPNVSWSKESGWEKLNEQLSSPTRTKTILPLWPVENLLGSYWLYAAAAAITLMVVSVYSVKNYWTVIEEQPAATTMAVVTDDERSAPHRGQKDPSNLEKSILSSAKPDEMSAEKIKEGVNPFFITDPDLKSQLLVYHNLIQSADDKNQHIIPALFTPDHDYQPSGELWPLLLSRGWAKPAVEPSQREIPANGNKVPFPERDAVLKVQKNKPVTVILGGNLTAVDRSFNLGLEGGVLFKFSEVNRKRDYMIGIGVDTRYQFYAVAENDRSRDHLNVADKDEVNNGFNTFVTASYSRNLSGKDKKPFWVGMKAGYLLHDNTNNFDDSTLMLEMIVGGNDSSKFKISPQVYLTDNLKRVMPGIKLGMTLGKFDRESSI